jgi:hypothetical protein
MNFKYDWGDEVLVLEQAPEKLRRGQRGSVCGMRQLEGVNLYLVEFSDGVAIEISEQFLK